VEVVERAATADLKRPPSPLPLPNLFGTAFGTAILASGDTDEKPPVIRSHSVLPILGIPHRCTCVTPSSCAIHCPTA